MPKCKYTETFNTGVDVDFECGFSGGRCDWCGGRKWRKEKERDLQKSENRFTEGVRVREKLNKIIQFAEENPDLWEIVKFNEADKIYKLRQLLNEGEI